MEDIDRCVDEAIGLAGKMGSALPKDTKIASAMIAWMLLAVGCAKKLEIPKLELQKMVMLMYDKSVEPKV